MKIGVIGGGIVGRATARAWQEHCREVRLYDRIRVHGTHDLITILESDLIFVCVPEDVVDDVFSDHALPIRFRSANFVLKSTVPVGTTRRLAKQHGLTNLVHSPEFLTERCAIWDAQNPASVIIGSPKGAATLSDDNKCYDMYFDACQERFPGINIFNLSSDESELVKLAVNAFAATKVAFFNEMWSLSDALGLNWERVVEGILSDGRIGNAWTMVPGPDGKLGFGGRCLPKDLRTTINCFNEARLDCSVLDAVQEHSNEEGS